MQYSKADKETVEEGQLDKQLTFACKKGMKPESPNQDDFCIIMHEGLIFIAVFDGHGK